MALNRIISKAIIGNLDRELGTTLQTQMGSAMHMVDNMMAPSAYAYTQPRKNAAFSQGMAVEAPSAGQFGKVYMSVNQQGMFKDCESFDKHYPMSK